MQTHLEEIKKLILPILREGGVLRSAIFGSMVRNQNHPESDIDILVELPSQKSLLDLIRLEKRLQDVLDRKVDLLTYNSLNPLLKERILKEQITIL